MPTIRVEITIGDDNTTFERSQFDLRDGAGDLIDAKTLQKMWASLSSEVTRWIGPGPGPNLSEATER